MKKITVTDSLGNEYTLEFTRETVQKVEKSGFNITKADERLVDSFMALFKGAFLANHKDVKEETIEKMVDDMTDIRGLYEALIKLYTEPVETLFDEKKQGNAKWGVNW